MAELTVIGRIELVEGAGVSGVRRVCRARRILILGLHIERFVRDRPAPAEGGIPGTRAQVRGAYLTLLPGRLQTIFDSVRHRSRQAQAERVETELVGAILAAAAREPARTVLVVPQH